MAPDGYTDPLQADWLAYLLHGRYTVSDWNNALKASEIGILLSSASITTLI